MTFPIFKKVSAFRAAVMNYTLAKKPIQGSSRYRQQLPAGGTRKVEVNGDRAHPIMKFLKIVDAADGSSLFANWNFNKCVLSVMHLR